ncbi:MAG: hypothetical protein RL172_1137 [Bacteroidota bacterium]
MPQNVGATASKEVTLVRALGLFSGTLLVAGVMIGSGVYKKIIPMAQTGLSEGWILMAWVIAGIVTMLGAFNLVGLTSLTEESGGVYEYLRLSFGNFFSFLFGWTDFSIIGSASVAALAFMFAQTVNSIVPLPNPLQQWEAFNFGGFIYPFADAGIKILALAAIGIVTFINYRGVKEGGVVNNIFTSAKITGIIILIVLGITYTMPAGSTVAPVQASLPAGMPFLSALFAAMLSAFWAYDGWLDISFVTGEIKNPKKNVPLAILAGVSMAMLLYVLVNFAYLQVVPAATLATVQSNQIGAAVVAQKLLGNFGKTLIVTLILISSFGSLNAVLLAHARVYYRMAQEKFFFKNAARVHPVYRTPYKSIVYTSAWSCVLVVSGTFDLLTDMVVFASFIFYILLALAVLKMKQKAAITQKLVGYPVVQVVVIIFSLALLVNTIVTQPKQTATGLLLVLLGVPFYLFFKQKNKQQ